MSGDQIRGSIPPLDRKDISGEEAWARRCSLPPIAPWDSRAMKTEESLPQDALPTQSPSTLTPVEEGESSGGRPASLQPHISEANAFLYSIPQWQSPPKKSTGQNPSRRPTKPAPAKRRKAPAARFKSLPPPSLVLGQQNQGTCTLPPGFQPPVPSNLALDQNIPGIYRMDNLDKCIGIRPRNKTSIELRILKRSPGLCGKKGKGLSQSMETVIQQFMVANSYICPHLHTPVWERPVFRHSLLTRLDLHNTFRVTKETDDEQRLIRSAWTSIDAYVSEKSREWRAQGVFEQASEKVRPTFAVFTKGWTDRNWNGSTGDPTHAPMLRTMTPAPAVVSVPPEKANGGSRPTGSETTQETGRQLIGLDVNTEESLNKASPLKRSGPDGLENATNKRARTCKYDPNMKSHECVDHVDDEKTGLDFTGLEEKGLPVLIEAIHQAQARMLDLAPMSAKDLAIMQQDWTSHGFPTMLAETLTIGRAYTTMMGNYFNEALKLLSLLKESDHWKASQTKVQVDCACQTVGTAAEQSQIETVSGPSSFRDGEFKVQHSHGRDNTVHDGSQNGRVSNQPVLSSGFKEADHSCHSDSAAPEELHEWNASDQLVALTEKAGVDRLYETIFPAPDQVSNEEVTDPEASIGTAKKPCLLM